MQQDADVRPNLVAALLRNQYDPAIALAEHELFDHETTSSLNVRLNLLYGLQGVNPSKSVPLLARALRLPESEFRQVAARALQSTESDSAINPLLLALNDPDRDVQFCVMQSLGYLNHELEWRPHGTEKDAFWDECIAHWQALARIRLFR